MCADKEETDKTSEMSADLSVHNRAFISLT